MVIQPCVFSIYRKRKEIRYGGDSKYDEYIEDKGSALSSLTVLAVFIGTHMAEILPFLFAGEYPINLF